MFHKPVVVGIGELLWDILPTGKRAGGAPINVVYHASKHCADGYAVSAVGNDRDGDEIIAELQKKHIKYVLDRNNYPTSKVIVNLKDGIPFYTITENTAWDHIRPLPQALSLIQKADAVCYGSLAFRHIFYKRRRNCRFLWKAHLKYFYHREEDYNASPMRRRLHVRRFHTHVRLKLLPVCP